MTRALAQWNQADKGSAIEVMMNCCGAHRWAAGMVEQRPIVNEAELHAIADRLWNTMGESDWTEAFACHPRIGERKAERASRQSSIWSGQEQSSVQAATEGVLTRLAQGNSRYEERFGFTYIVCATGKSPEEMLSILERRLVNDHASELREAAEQQRQILHIRLRKWLEQ